MEYQIFRMSSTPAQASCPPIDDVLATVLNETPSTNFASQKVSETNRPTFPHGNMFILSDKR